jgi:hypothetical protein
MIKKTKSPEISPKSKEWKASLSLYKENFCVRDAAVPENLVILFADDMVLWAENDPSALKLSMFFHKHRLSRDNISNWSKKWPWFSDAVKLAKGFISDRRETMAVYGKMPAQIHALTMGCHDEDYRDFLVWQSTLKEEKEKEPITILIKRFTEELDKK